MSFVSAEAESRDRFNEARLLLVNLREGAPPQLHPVSQTQKALRGLWLVSLYAAVERSVNSVVEAALSDISAQRVKSIDSVASLHSIFHFPRVQSLHGCGRNSIFDKSVSLFEASSGTAILETAENPLAESLQNVDGKTMQWVLRLFGATEMIVPQASLGRTSALRERRNAVAHGRESAAKVGERYTIAELENIYQAADETVASFVLSLKDHCAAKRYLRQIA